MLKGIDKYNYYDKEFFSNGVLWEYELTIDGKDYLLQTDDDEKYYLYKEYLTVVCGPFDNIYKALDGIVFNGKTLRQIIIETDFEFDSIL